MNILFKLTLLGFCFVSFGCSSLQSKPKTKPNPISSKKKFKFEFSAEGKKTEKHRMYIGAYIKKFSGEDLRSEEETVTEVGYEIQHLSKHQKFNYFKISVTDKDGRLPLASFGFPEYQQSFNFVTDNLGRRLKVGNFKESSFYYIPSVFLPKKPVAVGDTWESEFEWLQGEGLARKIVLTSIFKNAYQCGIWQCADIEISAQVYMSKEEIEKLEVENDVVARYIIQIHSGSILWSSSISRDRMRTGDGYQESYLCSVTKMMEPSSDAWPWADEPECNARKEFNNSIPGL